jgi:hypothetical protein
MFEHVTNAFETIGVGVSSCMFSCRAGYKSADADYSLTRAAKVFSVLCALCETLGALLVLSNDPIIVQFGIFLHLRDAPLHYLDPDY